MDKKTVRKFGIQRLDKLAHQPENKQAKEARIYQKLFASDQWRGANSIGITFSTTAELNTLPIIEAAMRAGKKVALPKTYPKRQLHFIEISEETEYNVSKFGIKEPLHTDIFFDKPDLLIVPGVVFKPSGYRIGFGGGFYDRFLTTFKGQTISLVFTEQLCDDWQAEAFDLPVDLLITDE
ncbi:5-formyltetrahydrofolate cyclo-ligase [Enterococcus sp. HY326]|uniref:5-formyltetrahydrofolate cyclo-ligase n=1 Tax=Enterococcus sp. HY326 TaxID=2971265 RepID=UPI00223FCF48|nr:5-formyltetrahydrofolate cyclo-ligase [Enterococcus sp. HY326]